MAQAVRKPLVAGADADDLMRRKLVPCFDDFYHTALELLPFAPDAGFEVLDLGAGTGTVVRDDRSGVRRRGSHCSTSRPRC